MAKVASVNSNTIVVVNSVGPIIMEPWINNVNGETDFYSILRRFLTRSLSQCQLL